jgi:hypothetical protein
LRNVTLFIADLHAQYQHPKAFRFLRDIKKEYKLTHVASVGDLADYHATSRHPKDPDGRSAGDELKLCREALQELYSIFPKMTIAHSNHDARPYKMAYAAGLSNEFLRSYNEILKVGPGWEWKYDFVLNDVYVNHGEGADAIVMSKRLGCNVVQGHRHSKGYIQHWSGPTGRTHWAGQTGCLVDPDSYAMAYGKTSLDKPVLGSIVVVDGLPEYLRLT